MKKFFFAAGIVLMATTVTLANDSIGSKEGEGARTERRDTRKGHRGERRAENRNEVSLDTRNQFAMDFPSAKGVRFEKTKNFDEVFFMSGKKSLIGYYDIENNLIGTSQTKHFKDLPENAQAKILKDYSGYTIKRVIKFDDSVNNDTDMILYGTSFDDADNYFVELRNADKALVVKVGMSGDVFFFSNLK